MKNSIVTIGGKRGEYTGYSELTKKHHVSFYDGSAGNYDSLEGAPMEGTRFNNLYQAVCAEWDKRHAEFVLGLQEAQTVEGITRQYIYHNLLTKAKAAKTWELSELKNYLIKRHEKRITQYKAEKLAHLQAVEIATPFTEIQINVEWKKNRTWGANPTAEARIRGGKFEVLSSGSIGGCGYDKESTAIANALNQSAQFLHELYEYKELNYAEGTDNRNIFGYGSGYGVLPYLEGGVGVSCYPQIFKTIGYEWRQVGSGKMFNAYLVTRIKKD